MPRPHPRRSEQNGPAQDIAAKPSGSVDPPRTSKSSPFDNPELYINRELSLLEFQRRVLEEAEDPGNPLLERIKFLAILSSNLDEFFMVRVAGLLKQVAMGSQEVGIDGRSASAQLQLIRREVAEIAKEAHRLWREDLRPALACAGIRIVEFADLSAEQQAAANAYFLHNVFPVLTPLAFDESRPFPHISNRSVNLAVVVRDQEGENQFARVKVPDTLPQLVRVKASVPAESSGPEDSSELVFVWLEQVIAANLHLLFPGLTIVDAHPFRVTRDADVAIQELESDDLLETIEEAMRQRRFLAAVRVQVSTSMPQKIVDILTNNIEIDPQQISQIENPIGFSRLFELYALEPSGLERQALRTLHPSHLRARVPGGLLHYPSP